MFPLACWCYLVWILLTWTRTAEQLIVGAAVSLLVGAALAPLGKVPGPWRLLVPRNAVAALRLLGTALIRIPVANVRLARRIWAPSRPLRSGMVIVPTHERTDLGLTTVGLVTSLIVDNQIVDLDRRRHQLQYHAVDVPEGGRRAAREAINGPVERCLDGLRRSDDQHR
ncbi:MAG TPA: Na+/H+ antiporter subunit E [Actinospica sp.]|jgi:multicomponent Na+:H+ antiporter subunit E|nr:Na+/H+ antiporter subunit E [Actinospica sp.]